jgi:hypothetical protein
MSRNKMFVRRSPESEGDEFNIWAAFTDLMSNSFLILSLLLILISLSKIGNGSMDDGKRYKNTLIISEKTQKVSFMLGSAKFAKEEMKQEFYKEGGIIEEIDNRVADSNINLVEIIGHTDQTSISGVRSNLDTLKPSDGVNVIEDLTAGSNADLGLIRSLQIMRILRDCQEANTNTNKDNECKNKKLKNFKKLQFRVYSAAQLVAPKLPNNEIPKDDDKRRIEIRFTRLD